MSIDNIITACSDCKKLKLEFEEGEYKWIDYPQLYAHYEVTLRLSHGYCPECYEKVVKEYGLEE